MASQVLSGSSDVSYTNNTGQNVRIIINYMKSSTPGGFSASQIRMSWAGVTINGPLASGFPYSIGRNLAFFTEYSPGAGGGATNNMGNASDGGGLPTELMLAPNQTFSTTGVDAYNIVVIPEAG